MTARKRKIKRRSLRALDIDELQARYDRAVERMLKAARRADKLHKILERRLKPVKDTLRDIAGPGPPLRRTNQEEQALIADKRPIAAIKAMRDRIPELRVHEAIQILKEEGLWGT